MELAEPGTRSDVLEKKAVKARNAQVTWRNLSLKERVFCLSRMRHVISRDPGRIVKVLVEENGKTELEGLTQEVVPLLDTLVFLEKKAPSILRETPLRLTTRQFYFRGKQNFMFHEPYGVIGILGTWNYPFFLCMSQLLFAVTAGNAVFLKGAPESPLVTRLIQDLCNEAGFPPHLVTCFSADAKGGEALLGLKLDKYILTGSRSSGRNVLAALSKNLKPIVMELSGCDGYVILSDADWKLAVDTLVWASFQYSGQTCVAPRRVILLKKDRELFLNALSDSWKRNAEFIQASGNLRSAARASAEKTKVEALKAKGARLEMGEPRLDPASAFFPPQVYSGLVAEDLREVDFMAPVFFMIECATEDEALEAANASAFALGASLWTRDEAKARRFAREVRAGQLWVNDSVFSVALGEIAFGGFKDSGFGKTRGPEGLLEMVEPKFVSFDRRKKRFSPHLPPYLPSSYAMLTEIQKMLFLSSFRDKLRALWAVVRLGAEAGMKRK